MYVEASPPRARPRLSDKPAKRFHSSIICLINDGKRKIFFTVDNLRVHHAKREKEWLQENKHRIEVHDLPSYSPEPNPNVSTTNRKTLNRRAKQYLNNDLKQNLSRQGVPSNQSQLEDRVSSPLWQESCRL